eukprot:86961-Prymnesium_polylepis.1
MLLTSRFDGRAVARSRELQCTPVRVLRWYKQPRQIFLPIPPKRPTRPKPPGGRFVTTALDADAVARSF